MAVERHKLFDHSLTGVACRLLVAPFPSLLIAAGLITLPWTPLDQWPGLIVGTITKCLVFGAFLGLVSMLIGLPLYLLYRRLNWHGLVAFMAGAAAIAGALYCLPELGLSQSGSTFSYSTATCEVIVNNVRTACGWDEFRQGLCSNLAYGALAGAVFWVLLAAGTRRANPTTQPISGA